MKAFMMRSARKNMKKRLALAFIAVILSALAGSFNSAQAAVRIKSDLPFPVTASTDIKYLEVSAVLDRDFELKLDANQQLGGFWSEYPPMPSGISFVSQSFTPVGQPPAPTKEEPRPGWPGTDRRVYHASSSGAKRLLLKYSQPGKPEAYAVVKIHVKLK